MAVSGYRVGVCPVASHFLSHLCHFAYNFFKALLRAWNPAAVLEEWKSGGAAPTPALRVPSSFPHWYVLPCCPLSRWNSLWEKCSPQNQVELPTLKSWGGGGGGEQGHLGTRGLTSFLTFTLQCGGSAVWPVKNGDGCEVCPRARGFG